MLSEQRADPDRLKIASLHQAFGYFGDITPLARMATGQEKEHGEHEVTALVTLHLGEILKEWLVKCVFRPLATLHRARLDRLSQAVGQLPRHRVPQCVDGLDRGAMVDECELRLMPVINERLNVIR